MHHLASEIQSVAIQGIAEKKVCRKFSSRTNEGRLTRDENNVSHFCVYFLPYNSVTRRVFLIHHKKSGLWIFPGGHIDAGEYLIESVRREIKEELGIEKVIGDDCKPFLLTITPIDEPERTTCHEHFDIWYRFETDGDFNIDPREFLASKWLTIEEARSYVTDKPNLLALEKMEQFFAA